MSSEGMIRCPHCGKLHPQETIYCPENGMPIYQLENERAQTPAPARRPNTILIIVAAAVVVALLCIGAVAAYFLWIRPAAQVAPTPTQQLVILETVFQPTATLAPPPTSAPQTSAPPTATPNATETVVPDSGPWDACPTAAYQSRLRVDDKAKVSEDPPLPNRVRSQPLLTATIIGRIEPGEEVTILEGPGCSSNWVWWRVRSLETGLEGWTAEGDEDGYWLVPDND